MDGDCLNNKKNMGQFMTPPEMVSFMLDMSEYYGAKILSKKVCEPSFGDGAFLKEIISRIIYEGEKAGKTKEEIRNILCNNVFGFEKDKELYDKAIAGLNKILTKKNIEEIKEWHLYCADTTYVYIAYPEFFDYIFGNPPYIRVHNMDEVQKQHYKTFSFCKKIIDAYVLFFEIGIKMMNANGVLCYITPNSFLKNTSAEKFREYLINNRILNRIYNFSSSKIFPDADTYTAVTLLDKGADNSVITYKEFDNYSCKTTKTFSADDFAKDYGGKIWTFHIADKGCCKFDDIANIQTAISTNCDKVYVIKAYNDVNLSIPYTGGHNPNEPVYFESESREIYAVESGILKRCIKGSKFNGVFDNTYIVCPYKIKYAEGLLDTSGNPIPEKYIPMTEKELEEAFPLAYQYLFNHKDMLCERNMESNVPWFLYARSQGLTNMPQKKIVVRPILKKGGEPSFFVLDEDVFVYSGVFVTVKKEQVIKDKVYDTAKAEELLINAGKIMESKSFRDYLSAVGKDLSGGYIQVTAKMIKNFPIE